ncbi:MAG: putative small GTP-binding protein domain, partial [Streblomastix strix]
MGSIVAKLRDVLNNLWKEDMEICLLGLQGAGKSTLVNIIAGGEYEPSTIPTIGFQMKTTQKCRVNIKLWDVGGQTKFRPQWARYC